MNRLAGETSPYLRQHAENPVDWYPWGEEAFAAARERGIPILVSIGYASCHWCHVMAHESFEDDDTAAVLNAHFVAVKVDREERPDVDAVYMESLQALSGSGGWPLNVFLTPDGRPFFGGTYFPPDARPNSPSFTAVLEAVHDAWEHRREQLTAQADELTAVVANRLQPPPGTARLPAARELVHLACVRFSELFDPVHGGIGTAPKFPQAPMLELLLRAHLEGEPGALAMVEHTLLAMASGGIYDQVGGGFCRYSVDRAWAVPHFEKMLYDQAALGRVYLHAFQITGDERYRQVLRETCDFVLRELEGPDGGCYSSFDADSPGGEGRYYTFTPGELEEILGTDDGRVAAEWYGVRPGGNFERGETVLSRAVRGEIGRAPAIESIRERLAVARRARPGPARDEKVLAEWNAMFASLLAEAAAALGDERLGAAAERIATFIVARLRRDDGRLMRSYTDGRTAHLGVAGDYAWTIECLTRCAELTGRTRYLEDASALASDFVEHFIAADGGVYLTGSDAEPLVVRPVDLYDGVVPSASSVAASALARLGALADRGELTQAATAVVRRGTEALVRGPLTLSHLLGCYLGLEDGLVEVVVGGRRRDLVEVVRGAWRPDVVLAWGEPGPTSLWEARDDDRAYVCRAGTCLAPVGEPEALADALASATARSGR